MDKQYGHYIFQTLAREYKAVKQFIKTLVDKKLGEENVFRSSLYRDFFLVLFQ